MDQWQKFAAGDLEAFEAVFREFQGRVYGWIVRIVRDTGVAEDLTVETFWRIYKARARFDHNGSFGAWAYRIAMNLALDHLRQRPRMVQLASDVRQESEADPAVQSEQREKVRRALLSLPPRLQIVATMSLIDQRSQQEVAEALGISTGTVKSRTFRAVRLLRRKLEQMGVKP